MENFDAERESSYIMYVDCNNLYGKSMTQNLPIRNFEWCTEQFDVDKILNIADDSETGCIFEVDLEYPDNIHDLHSDFPFCPEHLTPPNSKNVKKLMLTLHNKKNYIIHYRMLKLAIKNGLILTKIHRILKFEQTAWLKPYIMLNTRLRSKATNDFDKNLYKLMNNAIFGKSMEDVRSRKIIKLTSTWSGRYGASTYIAKSNFKRSIIFDENLIAIELEKTSILMNKPVTIGMTILDISKVVMFEFYYNFLKKKYGSNICLAYTDTDSFILHIKTDDFYADMKQNLEWYDTSDYPENNKFDMPRVNKKKLGLFKDEVNSEIITSYCGLRSKMYCVRTGRIDKMKKAKGVNKNVLKREICFDDYVNCLKNSCIIVKDQKSFRTKLHNVFTIQQSKIALSPFDDKRHILENGIDTLAHGHFSLRN